MVKIEAARKPTSNSVKPGGETHQGALIRSPNTSVKDEPVFIEPKAVPESSFLRVSRTIDTVEPELDRLFPTDGRVLRQGSYTEKLVPQPQLFDAFGFSKTNPRPIRLSLKSITTPLRKR